MISMWMKMQHSHMLLARMMVCVKHNMHICTDLDEETSLQRVLGFKYLNHHAIQLHLEHVEWLSLCLHKNVAVPCIAHVPGHLDDTILQLLRVTISKPAHSTC